MRTSALARSSAANSRIAGSFASSIAVARSASASPNSRKRATTGVMSECSFVSAR